MKILTEKIQLSPTDLSNHLGCRHLTELNRLLALKEIEKPSWTDPALAVLAARGDEHEDGYVEHLRGQGLEVAYLKGKFPDATLEAMKRGVDVIVQAAFTDDGIASDAASGIHWLGYADILMKVGRPSVFGDWSYEVQDTKLSRNTRGATLLQLSLYSDMLALLQGTEPQFMYVVKPGVTAGHIPYEIEQFRFADFRAYYRVAKNALVEVMRARPTDSYPEPVEQCMICRWWKDCDKKRHDDDHLSLVAGIRAMHIGELQRQDIATLEVFARRDNPLPGNPDRGSLDAFKRIHHQARIQLDGRLQNRLIHELLPAETGRGLSRLPGPSRGDIYFDIEGDPFFDHPGLEYLLGYVFIDDSGELAYQKVWAKNRVEEKKAFERFMQFVMARLQEFPDLHIYHFAPYEPSAVKRLSLRHAIHEEHLDWLLRAERFIDLHAVAKEGLRASVERYSLKDLERFTAYTRKVELPLASKARRSVEFALELKNYAALDPEVLKVVEDYNEDDCRATHALHQWLEALRKELIDDGNDVSRPELKYGEAGETVAAREERTRSIFEGLTRDLPEDPDEWTDHHRAKWLLANQVDYFRREEKSAWWEFFRLHEMDFEDLLQERKGIAGLEYTGDVPLTGRRRLPVHKYRYPAQEVGLNVGDCLYEVKGNKMGTIFEINHEACTVAIKKTAESKDTHPVCVHEQEVVSTEPVATALCDLANSLLFDGLESMPYRAAKDLLLKRPPRFHDVQPKKLLGDGEDTLLGSIRIAGWLRNSVLGIQGPPGSGKTHTAAMMILTLSQQGKRIGVTAPSHKVIINLFEKVLELGARYNIPITLIHKAKDEESLPSGIEMARDSGQALEALNDKKVVGGTAWLWANDDARETLDYLFVDEAGQMSLAHALAASRSAKNLILLGDPQQLEQPQRASHPEGADVAALSHLLDGHHTMPDDKGIFLPVTRRLHPLIADFTSEIFYEGRLQSLPGLEKQIVHGNTPFAGAGLYYVPVQHYGRQNRSEEEVEVIARIVHQFTSSVVTWTNAAGKTLPLIKDDILIVAPYNAQVAALTEKLPGCRIGTVDKFQGQEAAVVIYSMTSSSSQDAPRGMSFLYNPNRLNVATSRAQCVSILVASEKLLSADCRSVDQMRWANALCRYREMSRQVPMV